MTDVSNCIFPDRFAGPLSDMLAAYWCQEFGGAARRYAPEGPGRAKRRSCVNTGGAANALDRPIKMRPSGGAQG